MYAIVEVGGHQWKVEPGTRLEINRVPAAVGAEHTVERILLAYDGQQVQVGRPYVQGAKVVCEVVGHAQGPKVISYHFRRRENWRKTVGHRQPLTRLIVKDILFSPGATVGEEPTKAALKRSAPKASGVKHATKKVSAAAKKGTTTQKP